MKIKDPYQFEISTTKPSDGGNYRYKVVAREDPQSNTVSVFWGEGYKNSRYEWERVVLTRSEIAKLAKLFPEIPNAE